MDIYRGVIDTNVLFAGLYSANGASYQILRLIESGGIVPILSTTLLFEYEDVLMRNRETLKLSTRAINDLLNGICSRAECRIIHFLWRPQLSDPKDDHVLELAVAANSADIITHNSKDFAQAYAFGIQVLTPAKLLGELK